MSQTTAAWPIPDSSPLPSPSPSRQRRREQSGDSASPDATTDSSGGSTMREQESNQLPNFSSGRWRIVGAWTSLRRSLDGTRASVTGSGAASESAVHAAPNRPLSHHHDGTGETTPPVRNRNARGSGGRKQVSVFLRRRRSAQPFRNATEEGDRGSMAIPAASDASMARVPNARVVAGGCVDGAKDALRRAKSNVVHPVSSLRPWHRGGDSASGDTVPRHASGAPGRAAGYDAGRSVDNSYVILSAPEGANVTHAHAAAAANPTRCADNDGQIDSVQSGAPSDTRDMSRGEAHQELKDVVHDDEDGAVNDEDDDGDLVGEICLEDFADLDADGDFEFLDGQSIDLGFEPVSAGTMGRLSTRPSLKLENNNTVRWIGDEKEFAKFFAEVGLDELLDGKEDKWASFKIDERVEDEWRASAEEHNRRCEKWIHPVLPATTTTMAVPRQSPIDIRDLAKDFGHAVASRNKA